MNHDTATLHYAILEIRNGKELEVTLSVSR